ncbi:MAG: ABC transporter substrate-binding protein [Bacillota bacterium]
MNNNYFKSQETLAEITDKYPELVEVLANKGFAQLNDEKKRKEFGNKVTLEQAANLKGLNLDKLIKLMIEEIESKNENVDITLKEKSKQGEIKIEGLLPCPVRVPLMEELEKITKDFSKTVATDLKAASQGLDWLKDNISKEGSAEDLSDIFISAGFDLFFDKKLMDKFRRKGVFKDTTGIDELNKVFKSDNVNLLDPEGDYSIISIVPAVFLINREELGGREVPKTWEEILSPEFANSVSLPVSDFDLFNAILINIYKNYGKKGIDNLARSMMKSQHPAQMVKEGGRKKKGEPAVTIMPYFFTRMAKRFPHMEFIWPEDGAIISPIFMLTKKESLPEIQPLVDFFASEKVGKILAEQGLFPSVLPEIDNNLKKDAEFMWPGWDFLRNEDPGQLIDELTDQFDKKIKEVS